MLQNDTANITEGVDQGQTVGERGMQARRLIQRANLSFLFERMWISPRGLSIDLHVLPGPRDGDLPASRLPGQIRRPQLPPRLRPGRQSRGPTLPARWAYHLWGLRDGSWRVPLGRRKVQVSCGLLRRVQHDTAHRQMSHQDMASQHQRRCEFNL